MPERFLVDAPIWRTTVAEPAPYHHQANRPTQASGQIGLDPRNLIAMAGFIQTLGSSNARERYEYFSDDLLIDDWMEPGEHVAGKGDVVDVFFDTVIDAFDDYIFEVHETIVAGNTLVVMGHFTGIFVRDFVPGRGAKPIPPTHKKVRWTARDVYHFDEGKIVRINYGNDTLTVARQLGAVADDGYPW